MDPLKAFKGKANPLSSPSFSIRYNTEAEELEQLYESSIGTEVSELQEEESIRSSASSPDPVTSEKKGKESPFLSKLNRRTSSLEDTPAATAEPWKFLTDIKGRITKTVEEKLEEIQRDRKKQSSGRKKKKKDLIQSAGSSISDSEEKSEASSSVKESSSPEKSEKHDVEEVSTEDERATTPHVTEVDISEETTPGTETSAHAPKGIRFFPRRKKKKDKSGKSEEKGDVVGAEPLPERPKPKTPPKCEWAIKNHVQTIFAWWPLFAPVVVAVMYKTVELPPHIMGMLVGILVTVEVKFFYNLLLGKDYNLEFASEKDTGYFDLSPVFKSAQSFQPDPDPEHALHEGWMNEFPYDYDPETYQLKLTRTVYVRLTGSLLRLATTRNKVAKRTMWNEPSYCLSILDERLYDISLCKVTLRPKGLAHKRCWSKKYPIYIELQPYSYLGLRVKEKGQIPEAEDKTPVRGSLFMKYSSETEHLGEDDLSGKESLFSLDSLEDQLRDGVEEAGNQEASTSRVVTFKEETPVEIDEFKEFEENDDDDISEIKDFEEVTQATRSHLYLFARSDREKEQWFRWLVAATTYSMAARYEEGMSEMEKEEAEKRIQDTNESRKALESRYLLFIKTLGQCESLIETPKQKLYLKRQVADKDVWVNVLMGRIVFDVLKEQEWLDKIQERIQRKLSTIKVPAWMDPLVVSHMSFGETAPVMERAGGVSLDSLGIWLDMDISYQGSFIVTIDTKLNLMKLKEHTAESPAGSTSEKNNVSSGSGKPAIFDSSMEDSAESSSEEPHEEKVDQNAPNAPKRMLNMFDKITSSKYFQQVTDYKIVKRAMEGVSSRSISLDLEVKGFIGTLVLNIPPPPSDRIWYGFRKKPRIWMVARPKFGEKSMGYLNITKWIEKIIYKEIQKVVVLPNMDDLVMPMMNKEFPS